MSSGKADDVLTTCKHTPRAIDREARGRWHWIHPSSSSSSAPPLPSPSLTPPPPFLIQPVTEVRRNWQDRSDQERMDTYGKKLGARIWSELNWYTRLSLGRQGSYVCRSDLVSLWCLTLPVSLPLQMFVCLPSCLSVCPSVCILVCLSVCLSVCRLGPFVCFFSLYRTRVSFSSVQDGICALGKAHIRYTPSLTSFPTMPLKQSQFNFFLNKKIIPYGAVLLWSWRARTKHTHTQKKHKVKRTIRQTQHHQ